MKKTLILLLCAILFVAPCCFAREYVIGEGDVLDVAVWGSKELNVSVKVRPDGMITMPGLGDVEASGMTPRQLQKDLTGRLKDLVKNPLVTVTVREITNSKVYIFGGGVQSRVYELNRRTTLLQLLCSIGNVAAGDGKGAGTIAGGSPKIADFSKAYLIRNGKKVKENFYNLFIKGDMSEDIVIQSDDAIFIPQQMDRKVYVMGGVTTPKAIEFREGMTVMECILEAGGFTKFAKQNDTVILRREKDKSVSIPVKAKDLIFDNDLPQNLLLKPGDYVVVVEGIF